MQCHWGRALRHGPAGTPVFHATNRHPYFATAKNTTMKTTRNMGIAAIAIALTLPAPRGHGNDNPVEKKQAGQTTSFLPRKDVGKFIAAQLDITTFRSSLGPQLTPGVRHFADLDMKPTKTGEKEVEFDMEDWFFAITVLERADKNGDGIEDMLVEIEDRAKEGTYNTTTKVLLSRLSESGRLIAIPFEP